MKEILGFTNKVTAPIIEQREKEQTERAYRELIEDADEFKAFDAAKLAELQKTNNKLVDVVKAEKGGSTIGVLITTKGGGYGGDITIMTGVKDGKIVAIKVLKHKETPDIGTKIENEDFQAEFNDLSATENVKLVATKKDAQDVEKITGSTVSSRGVIAAVNLAIDTYKEIENEL